jgi:hypothetical protein
MNERRPMLIPPRLTMFGMIPTFANSFVDLIKRTLLDDQGGLPAHIMSTMWEPESRISFV